MVRKLCGNREGIGKLKLPRIIIFTLATVAFAWAMLLLFGPATHQERLFFASAKNSFFFDYFTPYETMGMEHPWVDVGIFPELGFDFNATVPRQNQCYPALPILFVNLFNESLGGALTCTVIGLCFYFLGLFVFFKKYAVPFCLPAVTTLVSAQVLFTFEVGNLIFYSAGLVLVFLAWYDSDRPLRRGCAVLALALATVFKIYPCLLGFVYLVPWHLRNWKCAFSAGVLFFLFLITPFAFLGGVDGFIAWLENAQSNSVMYMNLNSFGIYGLVIGVATAIGYGGEFYDMFHGALRVLSSCFAVVLLGRAFFKCIDDFTRICLLAMGMLFLPPTMMCYTVLYVVPLFIVGAYRYDGRIAQSFGLCWFFSCVPLQVPLLFGYANVCFSSAAMLDLCVILLWQHKFWKKWDASDKNQAVGHIPIN